MTSLEQISKRLNGLIIKRPGMVLGLWGEAGIGKTHAVRNLLRESSSDGVSIHATSSVLNLVKALPQASTLPAWVETLIRKLEQHEYLNTEQSLGVLAALLSENAPFILHLEDVHETKPEQLEWIVELAKVVSRLKGVALMVTSRNAPPEPFEAIRLEVLGFEAVKNLLEQEAKAVLPLEAMEWIHGRAAGNPLFTLEFFKFLARQGFVWNDGQQWRWHIPKQDMMPATVKALIENALNLVLKRPFVSQVLQTKAMIPRDSSIAVWREVSGLTQTQLSEGMLTLTQVGILKNDQLSHPLFQEVTLRTMPALERRDVARRTMLALQDQPVLAVEFLTQAQLSNDTQKTWFEAAVQSAKQRQDWSLAADLTIRALDLYPPLERTAQARAMAYAVSATNLLKASSLFAQMDALEVADVYAWAAILAQIGQLERAQALLEALPNEEKLRLEWLEQSVQALSLGEDAAGAIQSWDAHSALHDSQNAGFLIIVAKSLIMLSRFSEAAAILEQALQLAHNDEIKAQVLLTRGRLKGYSDNTSPIEDLQQALALFEGLNDTNGIAMTQYRLGTHLYYQGHMRVALQHSEIAKALLEKIGSQQYWTCAVMVYAIYTELAMYVEAERGLLEVDTHLAQTSFRALRVDVNTHLSYLYRYWQIPYGAMLAVKYACQALQITRDIQNPRVECNALYHLSKSETLFGRAAEGLQLANQALSLAEQLHYPAMQKYPLHARYQALKALGRLEEALQDLKHVEALMRQDHYLQDADFFQLELEMHHGNILEAQKYLERLRQNDNHAWVETALRLYPKLIENEITPAPPPERVLEVLGTIRIDGQSVQGRRRQELLILLLEARIIGKPQLEKLELLEALYPQDPEDRAASSLKELIRSTRTSLGGAIIQTTIGGYALGQIGSDVEEFLKHGDTKFWQGMYLKNLEFENSQNVQDLLEQALYNRMVQLLETDVKEASRVSRFLLNMNPYDLETLRISLYALRAARNYKTLERVYENAKGYLLEVGETLPENWSDFLTKSLEAAYPPQNLTEI